MGPLIPALLKTPRKKRTANMDKIKEKLHIGSSKQQPSLTPPSDADLAALKEKYSKAEQDQVFTFYDSLPPAEQAAFYDQLSDIDPSHINTITDRALNPPKKDESATDTLEPLPDSATASILDSDKADIEKWYKSGLELIGQDKVAVVLMAGGQGTRLGSSAPKGCYDIGLPSQKSLFQLQAERIWRLQHLANKAHQKDDSTVPWYIMTSGPTRKPTQDFFEEH